MAIVETTMAGEGVARVTLNDPDRYNALTPALIDGLADAFASIRRDRDVRVVILDGNGRGFCAGADMSGTGGVPDRSRSRGPVGFVHEMQEHLMDVVLAIHETPQPVVAALHGAVVGGGLALALTCDLRVASADAFFASHFILSMLIEYDSIEWVTQVQQIIMRKGQEFAFLWIRYSETAKKHFLVKLFF
jgi:enoyl-CoA hydratase